MTTKRKHIVLSIEDKTKYKIFMIALIRDLLKGRLLVNTKQLLYLFHVHLFDYPYFFII